MFGFHYYAPTRVVFGKGAEGKAGELAASAHCKKVLLHYGSGSVIDSAKAIGYGVANEGDVWDFYEHTRKAEGCLPIGVVLTIAAAGSEMS